MAINEFQQYTKRDIFPELLQHLEKREMTLMIGPRQAGKTVLMEFLKNHLIQEKHIVPDQILTFNLDIFRDLETVQDQADFIELLKRKSQKKKLYVFLDEVQRIDNAGRFFKGIYDSNLNVKFVLTGSSSLEIRSKLQESMAGRKKIFHIYPFSFCEFVRNRDAALEKFLKNPVKILKFDRKKLLKIYQEYLIFGGYPHAVTSPVEEEKKQTLQEIYTSYVEKDIRGFLEIKNLVGFHLLIKLLAGQIGQLVNIAELSIQSRMDRGTVERYLYILEETFILGKLLPYYRNRRTEIVKTPKYYFLDNGLRNYALNFFQPIHERVDTGLLLENSLYRTIFSETSMRYEDLRFWRTKNKAEVDFVVEKGNGIIPIEIKWRIPKPKISQNYRNFIHHFQPKYGLIVNTEYRGEQRIAQTHVFFIHPYELEFYLASLR